MTDYTPSEFEVELIRALAYKRIRERMIPIELAEKWAEGVSREYAQWRIELLAEVERAASEAAWGEGVQAQWRFTQLPGIDKIPDNPYRREETE